MTKRMLSMLLLMTLVLLPASQASAAYTRYVYTENGKTLNVRDSQMIGENVVGAVRCGAAVNVIQEYGGWAEIEYSWRAADGTPRYSAYVMTRYLVDRPGSSSGSGSSVPVSQTGNMDAARVLAEMNAEFASGVMTYPFTVVARPARASGWVNLRWAPSTQAERMATCPQGKELTGLAVMKNWYQVEDPATGMIGFISSKYVTRK